jgi:hypothetical protein
MVRRLAILLALGLTGCSAFSTQTTTTTTATSSAPQSTAVSQADRTHEYPTPAGPQRIAGRFGTPAVALDVFATAYINWTAATIAARMRALAALSVGQARSATALLAGQSAQDYELRHGGVANSGTVQAIAQLGGGGQRYVVVTEERTTATATSAYAGLRAAWHVTLATVARVPGGGWAVSSWQPQN